MLAGGAASAFALAAPATYTLPKLPYAFDALEPYIDARTREIHQDRHHQAYVDNLNKALAAHAEWSKYPIEELLRRFNQLPDQPKTAVRNHGGGHSNHSLFWQVLARPRNNGPRGCLEAVLQQTFGGFDRFQAKLKSAATSVFGSPGRGSISVRKTGC